MSGAIFENVYRDKLWRIGLSEYRGETRLSIWAHYQDRQSGDWRPCGGRGEANGCIVPVERLDELAKALSDMAQHIRSKRRVDSLATNAAGSAA